MPLNDPTSPEDVTQRPSLEDQLAPLVRKLDDNQVQAYLEEVACNTLIDGTVCNAHCYSIVLDGNLRPRVNDFACLICEKITDFTIPRIEIERASAEYHRTGSAAAFNRLNEKARALCTKLPKSGEGGEVLLSVLAETYLNLPQLFTKMALKTSAEMHVHGSDGIHAGVNETGHLTLYWGESKLYKNVSDAIRECFKSLGPFLTDAGGTDAAQSRDLHLLRDHLVLNDERLLAALKKYLDPDDPMYKELEYRGLCLVGFDCDSYPKEPNSKAREDVRIEIAAAFDASKAQLLKRLRAEKIESFQLEVFCLPFPSVDAFREAFRKELRLS